MHYSVFTALAACLLASGLAQAEHPARRRRQQREHGLAMLEQFRAAGIVPGTATS